jgi:hypothetical protein
MAGGSEKAEWCSGAPSEADQETKYGDIRGGCGAD